MLDSMQLDGPAAQSELTVLRAMKVGDIREGTLFPALDEGLVFRCVSAEETRWGFEVTFCGQLFSHVVIKILGDRLVWEEVEAL